jgi:hypothetical protein
VNIIIEGLPYILDIIQNSENQETKQEVPQGTTSVLLSVVSFEFDMVSGIYIRSFAIIC